MTRCTHIHLPPDKGNDYILSVSQSEEDYLEVCLMVYIPNKKGYVLEGNRLHVYDHHDLFDIVYEAIEHGELSIFMNHYEIELDSSNDNVVRLAVDNDWPVDRADD